MYMKNVLFYAVALLFCYVYLSQFDHLIFLIMWQELVIQQLQDEILNLRKGATNALTADIAATNNSSPVQELKSKLKLAAKHIAQLAKERQQLIEMGNKLRAELNKAGTDKGLYDIWSCYMMHW